jgi:hypothetical protein
MIINNKENLNIFIPLTEKINNNDYKNILNYYYIKHPSSIESVKCIGESLLNNQLCRIIK